MKKIISSTDRVEEKTVAVSGGFDPIHIGHVRMIREAAQHGGVIVVLNSDEWLKEKKGYAFMTWDERAEIINEIRGVLTVVPTQVEQDNTVCNTLRFLKEQYNLDYFANGGDRMESTTPEMRVCDEIGVKMLWNIGGGKVQSSSTLVNKTTWGKRRANGIEL